MKLLETGRSLLAVSHAHGIVRRYFVVNGFDGALTMLGLVIGFLIGGPAKPSVVIDACLGVAIALGISGVSSAYLSETAERRRALKDLEDTMLTNLEDSSHGAAARWIPMLVALTNGAAPLLLSLLIIMPLWLDRDGFSLPLPPLQVSACIALLIIFLLGVYLGRVAGVSWLKSGVRTLLIAALTATLIYVFTGG